MHTYFSNLCFQTINTVMAHANLVLHFRSMTLHDLSKLNVP